MAPGVYPSFIPLQCDYSASPFKKLGLFLFPLNLGQPNNCFGQ